MTTEPPIFSTLAQLLRMAADNADLALKAAQEGKHNLAIGTIIDLEQTLPAAEALVKVALTLHRLSRNGGAL